MLPVRLLIPVRAAPTAWSVIIIAVIAASLGGRALAADLKGASAAAGAIFELVRSLHRGRHYSPV